MPGLTDSPHAQLEHTNVLITGGVAGLGQACAQHFVRLGARVILADRNAEKGLEFESSLVAAGFKAKFIQVDVSSAASQARMIRDALHWLPAGEAIDHAIFCAGITGGPFDLQPEDPAPLDDPDAVAKSIEDPLSAIQINLTGLLQGVQLVVKYGMGLASTAVKRDKSVTMLGSIASFRALPPAAGYTASKFGVRGVFRTLRMLLPSLGVRANLIAPAFVETGLLNEETSALLRERKTRFATREKVAEAVLNVSGDVQYQGRALAVVEEGIVELKDDVAGKDAADVLQDLSKRQAFNYGEAGTLFEA